MNAINTFSNIVQESFVKVSETFYRLIMPVISGKTIYEIFVRISERSTREIHKGQYWSFEWIIWTIFWQIFGEVYNEIFGRISFKIPRNFKPKKKTFDKDFPGKNPEEYLKDSMNGSLSVMLVKS